MFRKLLLFAVAMVALALPASMITTTPAPAQSIPIDDRYPDLAEYCSAVLAGEIEPEGPLFGRLPSVCFWHYLGWDCEPEQYPPDGWLRVGGYCDQAKERRSLTFDPDDDPPPVKCPRKPVMALGVIYEPEPCYTD